ncbi:MAG TPA: methylated-DNA--[protein]-cysteine S-methyltransferase [Oligoflexus sp.]|uniref:methylated-DNA--[protein]-cysteine S-methyltransferase n=1 Tax=Oligoflexus sp. TaxID=1971216 RepID=UPI002D6D99A6|nr:methylated-DNA--[protein]-cysteine S-methyltransferase [Oligoflexus sp.]HYX36146.1 methylated-DNA--[protein]-cysteine S-methyltransferase [Oligoflexus sp.]
MSYFQLKITSKLGPLFLVASEEGLCGVHWEEQPSPFLKDHTMVPAAQHLLEAAEQIEAYLNGERKLFDVTLAPQGTAFQREVWNELRQIPYGQTISYQELAIRVKRPKACRAVGSANGKNPLTLIIPCHRVIASNASLGGYSGGLDRKSWLLSLESL